MYTLSHVLCMLAANQYTNLVILICSDGSELGSRKMEGLKIVPVQVIDVIGLHHMEAGLVLVHTVHNDLQMGDIKETVEQNYATLTLDAVEQLTVQMHNRKCCTMHMC